MGLGGKGEREVGTGRCLETQGVSLALPTSVSAHSVPSAYFVASVGNFLLLFFLSGPPGLSLKVQPQYTSSLKLSTISHSSFP